MGSLQKLNRLHLMGVSGSRAFVALVVDSWAVFSYALPALWHSTCMSARSVRGVIVNMVIVRNVNVFAQESKMRNPEGPLPTFVGTVVVVCIIATTLGFWEIWVPAILAFIVVAGSQ